MKDWPRRLALVPPESWWERFVGEMRAIGCIEGEPDEDGDPTFGVPAECVEDANKIIARYAANHPRN